MEDINICLACDKNYIKYALVTITSILENNRENHINFYVMHPVGIEEDYYKKAIETLKNKYLNFDISFVPMDISGNDLRGDKINFFNEAQLYRVYIPQLFPQLHRMLYLDSDIIVRRDIGELYKMPLGDYYIAAVIDMHDWLKDVLVPEYFNDGVLLMDLDKLRGFDFTLKTLTVLKYIYLRHFDQDAINMVCNGKIKSIHREFNYFAFRRDTGYQYKDPTIVHFPCCFRGVLRKEDTSVFAKEWWKYAKMSPMADQIKEPTMRRSWYY